MVLSAIPYDRIVQSHLRRVVRDALLITLKQGLPGEHHFYITFRTDHPRVLIPDYLKRRYQDDMTIVLQHRFFNLRVGEDQFQVELTFDNVPEDLTIPFEAITVFNDPAANFLLRFEPDFKRGDEQADGLAELALGPPDDNNDPSPPDGKGGKVVRLDMFRKR